MKEDPKHPGKRIDPATGIWVIADWCFECQRGFVRHERFDRGTDRVIAGTNRASQRKWRKTGVPGNLSAESMRGTAGK